MKLKVFQPVAIFLETGARRIVAEGPAGSFGILPRHVDLATALSPGILGYETDQGREAFLAVDGGILVKQGDEVLVATRLAVSGELGALRKTVDRFLTEVDERERKARSAVARLEASFVRRLVEFGKGV